MGRIRSIVTRRSVLVASVAGIGLTGGITGPVSAQTLPAAAGISTLAPGSLAANGQLGDAPVAAGMPANSPDARSAAGIPTWSGSFTYQATKYPFTMVGNTPSAAGTKTVPVSVTPLKFVVAGGSVYPTTAVRQTTSSHLFTNYNWGIGTLQYGDAVQREEFGGILNSGSHSLLGKPTVKPLVTITVPAADGSTITASDGVRYAAINYTWLDAKIKAMAAKAPAGSFPLYLSYETYLYTGNNPSQAGIGGYHSSLSSGGVHTYAYASWVTGDLYGPASANLSAMSHEVAEWFNDPFGSNTVPKWSVAGEPQYGCSNKLEVGDPLVGTVATVNGLNYQDEASFSWFARLSPSLNINHAYSAFGTFKTPATSC